MRNVTAALFVLVTAAGTAMCGDMEDAQRLFAYGEAKYPEYFSPAGAKGVNLLGYVARYYPATDVYLGVKGGWVYAHGAPFGGLMNLGPVDYYLGGIDSGNGGSAVNLICEWAGTRPSEPFPACAARIGVDLAQR